MKTGLFLHQPQMHSAYRFGIKVTTIGMRFILVKNWRYHFSATRSISFAVSSIALVATGSAVAQTASSNKLAPVTVAASANRDPAEKSYRKMLLGMDLFDRERSTAPDAALRFKLLPRKKGTELDAVELTVIGKQIEFAVPVAADRTFTLVRNAQALDENAQVTPNRKFLTMTWRTDIRTPGLPPNTRRLGDLRLECRVGMASGLISNSSTFVGRLTSAVVDTPAYCDRQAPQYLFFADQPLFNVTLVDGKRREMLALSQLYAGAIDNPDLKAELPFCDCEVLLDRTYLLPLGDRSWPDSTQVQFDFMGEAP